MNEDVIASRTRPITCALFQQKTALIFVLNLAIVLFCYWNLWLWLFSIWLADHEYSHGIFIPLITGYLVWGQRERLRHLLPRPSWVPGCILICLSTFFLVVGRAGGIIQSEALSLVLLVPSVIIFTFGWHYLRPLVLPILYFLFLIPWLDFIGPWMGDLIEQANIPFQYISAELGASLLRLAGYSVFHDGMFIQLPAITMKVARECSGLRYVTSIIVVGLPLVYFTQKTRFRSILVLSSAVVITILSNSLRIAMAGVLGSHYGPDMLHGPFHILHGWLISFIGWGALFMTNALVRRVPSDNGLLLYEKWKLDSDKRSSVADFRIIRLPLGLIACYLSLLLIYLNLYAIPQPVQLRKPLSSFPDQMKQWQSVDVNWLNKERYFPSLNDSVSRIYSHPEGKQVSLFIGYYAAQEQGKSLISYRGSALHKNSVHVYSDFPFAANHGVLETDKDTYEIFFWYRLSEKTLNSRMETKIFTMLNALLQRRNPGAVIIIGNPSSRRDPSNSKSAYTDMVLFTKTFEAELSNLLN